MDQFVAPLSARVEACVKFLREYARKGVIPLSEEERNRLETMWDIPNDDRVPKNMPTLAEISRELFRVRVEFLLQMFGEVLPKHYGEAIRLSDEEYQRLTQMEDDPTPDDIEFLERIQERLPSDEKYQRFAGWLLSPRH